MTWGRCVTDWDCDYKIFNKIYIINIYISNEVYPVYLHRAVLICFICEQPLQSLGIVHIYHNQYVCLCHYTTYCTGLHKTINNKKELIFLFQSDTLSSLKQLSWTHYKLYSVIFIFDHPKCSVFVSAAITCFIVRKHQIMTERWRSWEVPPQQISFWCIKTWCECLQLLPQ